MNSVRFSTLLGVFLAGFLLFYVVSLRGGPDANPEDRSQQAPASGLPSTSVPESRPPAVGSDPVDDALRGYAEVGSSLAKSSRLGEVGWNEEQINAFVAGVRSTLRGQGYELSDAGKQLFNAMARQLAVIDRERRAREFADPARVEAYIRDTCAKHKLRRTESGLGYGIMEGGVGVRPSPEDTIVFNMSAAADDMETDIPSLTREKMRARVSDLMPGLSEGVQMMTLGSKAMLIVPPALSFGAGKWPDGAVRGAPIIVIVELLEIVSPPPEP